ncbi:hypothetical protein L9F63_006884, partial [Diploptera punctata]
LPNFHPDVQYCFSRERYSISKYFTVFSVLCPLRICSHYIFLIFTDDLRPCLQIRSNK